MHIYVVNKFLGKNKYKIQDSVGFYGGREGAEWD